MTRPCRTIKPSAGEQSVPRERLREAAIEVAVRSHTRRLTRQAAREVSAFFEAHGFTLPGCTTARGTPWDRSARQRRVALALRRATNRARAGRQELPGPPIAPGYNAGAAG